MIHESVFLYAAVAAALIAVFFAFRGLRFTDNALFLRWFVAITCVSAAVILFPELQSLSVIRSFMVLIIVFSGIVLLYDFLRGVGRHMKRLVSVHNPFSKSLPEHLREICGAMFSLAESNIGALVVVERRNSIDAFAEAGIAFDASIKAEVLCALFIPGAPTHDGAVVVKKGRIAKVRAILPLSENEALTSSIGTRHRSALGISEKTDAIVFVVSEERGELSIGFRGQLVKVESEKHMIKLVRAALRGKSLVKKNIQNNPLSSKQ